jgi:signal transduction histidine kinase/CheY-like chemotaxis protein
MRGLPHSIYSRFSVLCLAGVVVLALAMGWTISSLLTGAVSEWEWENTAALVTREVRRSGLEAIFSESYGADHRRRLGRELSAALTTLPEVVRVKVWSRESEVIWSDQADLIGQRFPGNGELREALAGAVEVEIKRLGKSEQRYEARVFDTLAEVYVPVHDEGGRVIGVVEVYKTPDRLLATIRWSRLVVWTISLAGGALLYAVLLPLLTQVYRRQVEDETLRRHAARLETEIEQRTQQLMQAQKMEAIGLLAGGIAHDFNNILTVISGRAQILMIQLGRDRAARDNAASIAESAQRAAALTRQLLTFSRKQILERRTLDVNAVIVDMASMLQRLIGEHIRVVTTLARDGAYVSADRAQLEQVLLNLAVNARDAMPDGGELRLATHTIESPGERAGIVTLPAGRFVELVVRDTGSGMDEATRGRIFEPFFTTKAAGKGTGLGLSTVYAVAEQHDGHIVVESAPGQGATFRLYLPAVDDPVPAVVLPAGVPRVGCETVMLVEDDDDVRELATRFLLEHGYTVLAAADGVQALEAADAHEGPIHLLLTDVVMPIWTGWQVARQLRARRPETRVLYMTGYAEMPEAPDAPILQKPFTAFTLLQAVREVLDAAEPLTSYSNGRP